MNDINIIARKSDGYVNATGLCKAGNRLFSTYYRRKQTKEFLKVFSDEVQICAASLIKYQTGNGINQMTWVHPQIAINIAQWISPEFDVKVSRWVYELMLFGDIKLGKERPYEVLEKKLKEKNELIDNLNDKLKTISVEHKKLLRNHREMLRHKSVHYFKKGKCFYIVSNIQENNHENRVKIGISCEINARLKNHRVAMPFLKLHYLVFLNEYDLLERIMKEHYKYKLDPNNHEFISDVTINDVIKKARESVKLINSQNTEVLDEELEKYNIHTKDKEVEEDVEEEEVEEVEEDVEKDVEEDVEKDVEEDVEKDVEKEDVEKDVEDVEDVEEYIKRCPGKFHSNEDERFLQSIKFCKNKSTKDGYSTYCKECASKDRYKSKNHLEKKELIYDRKLFKYCPGKTHALVEDRIISLTEFHNNKSAKDGKHAYCKECEGISKYGENRKKRTIVYKQPPNNINDETEKWCQLCEKILLRTSFHKSITAKDGLQNGCKECRIIKRNN